MDKPTKPCMCGANEWIQRPGGGWNCNRCHPAPLGAAKFYSPEILALRDRVILGNTKLNDALAQLNRTADDQATWSAGMEQWHPKPGSKENAE